MSKASVLHRTTLKSFSSIWYSNGCLFLVPLDHLHLRNRKTSHNHEIYYESKRFRVIFSPTVLYLLKLRNLKINEEHRRSYKEEPEDRTPPPLLRSMKLNGDIWLETPFSGVGKSLFWKWLDSPLVVVYDDPKFNYSSEGVLYGLKLIKSLSVVLKFYKYSNLFVCQKLMQDHYKYPFSLLRVLAIHDVLQGPFMN